MYRTVGFSILACLVAGPALVPEVGLAQDVPAPDTTTSPVASLDGYLGLGPILRPNYTGGSGTHSSLIPIVRLEYKEVAYIYMDRIGARFWSTSDHQFALGVAAEPRYGFHSSDSPVLFGMANRRDTLEGGPLLEWQSGKWAVEAGGFYELTGISDSQSWRLSVYRQLVDNDAWDVGIDINFDRVNRAGANYYFGVRSGEATTTRPYYHPGAALNSSLELVGAYKLDKHYAVLFGSELMHLGEVSAESPIVRRTNTAMVYVGLGLVF